MSAKKGKFASFMRTQGLYIVLLVCIAAIGAAAFFAVSAQENEPDPTQVQKQQAQTLEEARSQASAIASLAPSTMPSASPSPSVSPSPSPTKAPKLKTKMNAPVSGQIIRAFSDDVLVFNQTLNMWMTHNGIDISGQEGSDVVAALAGTVSHVSEDAGKGVIVMIDHTNSRQTMYVGLSEASVKVGDKVNAKQVIGKLGTPGFEAAEGTHLHFEYLVNGKYEDPADWLDL